MKTVVPGPQNLYELKLFDIEQKNQYLKYFELYRMTKFKNIYIYKVEFLVITFKKREHTKNKA